MSFFRKLFGLSSKPSAEAESPAAQSAEMPASASAAEVANQAAREASTECLDRHWQGVGTVEQDVLCLLYTSDAADEEDS